MKNRRFHFEAMWVGETECESVIDHALSYNYHTKSYPAETHEVVLRKIDVCGKNLDIWNRKEFEHVKYQLNRAKGRLQKILEDDPACSDKSRYNLAREKVNACLNQEEIMWR